MTTQEIAEVIVNMSAKTPLPERERFDIVAGCDEATGVTTNDEEFLKLATIGALRKHYASKTNT